MYEQSGVFINVRDEDGKGGDLLLGGTLYITEVVSAVFHTSLLSKG